MRDFTVSEVLEYSRDIEKESYNFYKTVAEVVSSPELKELALELAEEEMQHFNSVSALIEEGRLTKTDGDKKIQVKKEDIDFLVSTREIPSNPSALSILEVAYDRELRTEGIYRTLLSLTNIGEDVVEVFSTLMAQEEGHARRINSMMNRL